MSLFLQPSLWSIILSNNPLSTCSYLNFKGCEEEGLYRVPGSGKDVKHWQKRFDTGIFYFLFSGAPSSGHVMLTVLTVKSTILICSTNPTYMISTLSDRCSKHGSASYPMKYSLRPHRL